LVSTAHASKLVDRVSTNDRLELQGIGFGVNAKLNRAWLKLFYHDSSCDGIEGCNADQTRVTKVTGLTYDAAHAQVVYSEDGSAPVVCARVVRHKIPLFPEWTTVDSTGACGYDVQTAVGTQDDGFETHEVTYNLVTFGVKARSGE
jgi:hypothetical protein